MHLVLLTSFIFVSFGVSLLYAARWSKWHDLTICDAKPCKCHGKKNEKCQLGKRVQIRTCIREDGDTDICSWDDKGGAMKLDKNCTNENVCPGWSDWLQGKCDCNKEKRIMKRFCNNPAPIHDDVLCIHEFTGEQTKTWDMEDSCNCTEEEKSAELPPTTTPTTTTTPWPTTPTTQLPCCMDYNYDDYEFDLVTDTDTDAKTTTSKPQPTKELSVIEKEMYSYYDEMFGSESNGTNSGETCRQCGNETDIYY